VSTWLRFGVRAVERGWAHRREDTGFGNVDGSGVFYFLLLIVLVSESVVVYPEKN